MEKVVRVEDLNTAGNVHFREDTLFKDEVDSNVGENFALPSSGAGRLIWTLNIFGKKMFLKKSLRSNRTVKT